MGQNMDERAIVCHAVLQIFKISVLQRYAVLRKICTIMKVVL